VVIEGNLGGPVAMIASRKRSSTIAARALAGLALLWAFMAGFNAAAADEPFRALAPAQSPAGAAVLLVPGCSGFVARNGINHYEERAIALLRAGYFVLFVDYLSRRHLTDCAGGRDVSHAQVAADVLEAVQWIKGEPRMASSQLLAIGWSYGGGSVLAALKAMPAEPPLIRKAVLYYPDCRQATPWPSAGVSVLILMGGMDEVTPPAACERALKGLPANSLSTVVYPNARHGFDMRGLPERSEFGRLGFDRGAAEAAWAVTLDFLR